jgi:DcmR-like sensory protein
VERSWNRFLHDSAPLDHGVQLYRDVSELSEVVAAYLAAGFEREAPALVIATPDHWRAIAGRLAESGWESGRVEEHGLLVVAEAGATLAAIMVDGSPSPRRFGQVVGGLLNQVSRRSPARAPRAFGEMVDLLCERGNLAGAAALEELWNRLARLRRFSLLCGYRIDLFDQASQVSVLPDVCRAHSHVLAADDPERLHRAVDSALEEALGPLDAGKVYSLIGEQIRGTGVPAAQLALMWVSAHMPTRAEGILNAARARYLGDPLGSPAG